MSTSTSPTFTPQVIGQTEKALNAILERELVGTVLTEPLWVTMAVTAAAGEGVARDQLVGRLVASLKIDEAEAGARLAALVDASLLELAGSDGDRISLTAEGRELRGRIGVVTGEITERLWGDLPAEDLAAAGRILSVILARADAELA